MLGLISKQVDDVFRHNADASRIMQGLIGIDTPYLFTVYIILHAHRRTVVHVESEHVLISDGIDDGIGMQGLGGLAVLIGLSTKQLGGGGIFTASTGIHGEDRRARKTKHHVFLHAFGD